jgi:hypothetical protein
MNNRDLENNLDKIIWNLESFENDMTKMSISKSEDFNLDYPYLIDVEDTVYSYSNETERDEDLETLCKRLTKESKNYFY